MNKMNIRIEKCKCKDEYIKGSSPDTYQFYTGIQAKRNDNEDTSNDISIQIDRSFPLLHTRHRPILHV
jgi:hypothetical protein